MVVRRLGLKQNSLIMLDADPHRKNFGRSPRNASPTRPSTVPTSPGRKGRPVSIPYSSKTRAKGETPTKPSLTPVVPGDRVYARQHCPQIRSVPRAECSVRCSLQLNIDLVASATADTWQQSELRGTIGSSTQRSPILAVRALILAKCNEQTVTADIDARTEDAELPIARRRRRAAAGGDGAATGDGHDRDSAAEVGGQLGPRLTPTGRHAAGWAEPAWGRDATCAVGAEPAELACSRIPGVRETRLPEGRLRPFDLERGRAEPV